tara:strand:+ start:445 stop:936 length:492 start_codon:yes stop_codon:yes gene_type:complete
MGITTSFKTFTKNYHKNNGTILPDEKSTIYIVRISHKEAVKDYNIMKRSKRMLWDKDSKNRIKKEDWLGFIVNRGDKIMIELYYIEKELSITERPKHWKSSKYTDQRIKNHSFHREVIEFKNQPILYYTWDEWKKHINYSPKYMPRGTSRSKNPFKSLDYVFV